MGNEVSVTTRAIGAGLLSRRSFMTAAAATALALGATVTLPISWIEAAAASDIVCVPYDTYCGNPDCTVYNVWVVIILCCVVSGPYQGDCWWEEESTGEPC